MELQTLPTEVQHTCLRFGACQAVAQVDVVLSDYCVLLCRHRDWQQVLRMRDDSWTALDAVKTYVLLVQQTVSVWRASTAAYAGESVVCPSDLHVQQLSLPHLVGSRAWMGLKQSIVNNNANLCARHSWLVWQQVQADIQAVLCNASSAGQFECCQYVWVSAACQGNAQLGVYTMMRFSSKASVQTGVDEDSNDAIHWSHNYMLETCGIYALGR